MIQNGRTLVANDNMVLTNGSIFAYEVSLGDWDKPEHWREITEVEAAEIQKEQEALIYE